MAIQNALTIDVEDYYQVSNFEVDIPRENWPSFPSRVVKNTERLLDILDRNLVKATFFVLGYVAEQHPGLVRSIDNAGHEIGSHSYCHRLIHRLSPDEFRQDLRKSRDLLQDLLGKPVTAFRAPSFSINRESMWALDVLAEEGFTSDSSIIPTRLDPQHAKNAVSGPYRYPCEAGELAEFPISVCRIGAKTGFPFSGGGYFRLYPLRLSVNLLRRVNQRFGRPFVFYTHPWEYDPDQPRLKAGTVLKRFRHYVNLATTQSKLESLLQTFSFGRLDEVLAKYAPERSPAVASANGLVS